MSTSGQTIRENTLPDPVCVGEEGPCAEVRGQESEVEASMKKQPLGQEPPVDSPLEEELSTQIKRSSDVTNWISVEKRGPKSQLNGGTEREERESPTPAMTQNQQHQQTRRKEKNIHLNGYGQAMEERKKGREREKCASINMQ